MKKTIGGYTKIGCAVLAGMLISQNQTARAGWSVNVDITGKGTVTVKVTSSTGQVSTTNSTSFLTGVYPSAAINPRSGTYLKTAPLPAGANPGTYVQIKGLNNYGTSITSTNIGGDLGDNDLLLPFVVPTSACAGGSAEIVNVMTNANSLTFQIKLNLSDAGSATQLRIVETNSMTQTSQLKYAVLFIGPYDNTSDDCEGTITVHGNPEQLNVLLDGTTSTLPFNITCPTNTVLLNCSSATYDPAPVVYSTLPYTVTYNPPPTNLVFGVTNIVTATARDINGCTISCQFKAYRQGIDFDGFDAPISGADATGGNCTSPLRSFKLGNVVPVKFAMSCNGVPITSGTPPTIRIQKCSGSGQPYLGSFFIFNNEWHFNIDSTVIGTGANFAGNYAITAILPDGSEHFVVIQYKK